MLKHHRESIENLVNRLEDDKSYLALIIGGSIAKGKANANSDIDVIIVAGDEEFEKRKAENKCHFYAGDVCSYPDGYADGKIVNLQFLLDAAEHGSEPARSAFTGAFIAYSHVPDLEKILTQIPVYQENERIEKIKSFYSQLVNQRWYIGEAEKRNDKYLLTRSVAELVLFGGRMILAYNRILYPYHKWLMSELKNATKKPNDIVDLIENLLKSPSKETGDLFYDCVMNYTDWEKLTGKVDPYGRFVEDSEWNWCQGRPPVQDL